MHSTLPGGAAHIERSWWLGIALDIDRPRLDTLAHPSRWAWDPWGCGPLVGLALRGTSHLGFVALVVAAAANLAIAAAVEARCNPVRFSQMVNGFAGTHGNQSGLQGIKANIEEDTPWVATDSEVAAWVMLDTFYAPLGKTVYAQVGWINDDIANSEHRTVFYEIITDTNVRIRNDFAAQPLGTSPLYQVTKDLNTNQFVMSVNGSVLFATANNWDPSQYQIYGETHNKADQMPGSVSNHEVFLNTYSKHGGSWWSLPSVTDVGGPGEADPINYAALRVNSIDYEIWDKKCP